MEITALITGIKYKIYLNEELKKIDFNNFNINTAPSNFILIDKNKEFGISKWISPKRTRSYPYERVYNTLNLSKKITIIPIVKDEGKGGDRDFIQWDTISLMSLLDVYVILGYYNKAEKHKTKNNKITNQQFDNEYIKQKLGEIYIYHSSALHWNLKEINTNLNYIIDKVKKSYILIEKDLEVELHGENGLDDFKEKISKDVKLFMEFSRKKAITAQEREFRTIQPKESLQTLTKAKITIDNYLGGKYFFTVDEIRRKNNEILLIESKHTKSGLFPSKSDIKDGLLKMILFCNLNDVFVDGVKLKHIPILQLTSNQIKGEINSNSSLYEIEQFLKNNNFELSHKCFIDKLFTEAKENNFIVTLKKG